MNSIKYQKSDKAPFITYVNLECIIEKIDGCRNNSENSFTTKANKHIASGFSMFTVSLFRNIENKHDVYRGKRSIQMYTDCIKTFVNT